MSIECAMEQWRWKQKPIEKDCNLHADCAEAEKSAGRALTHCSDEGCEDCFPK